MQVYLSMGGGGGGAKSALEQDTGENGMSANTPSTTSWCHPLQTCNTELSVPATWNWRKFTIIFKIFEWQKKNPDIITY